jgi:NTE family protein
MAASEVKEAEAKSKVAPQHVPGQVVLVLQGGGALGAYQGGVYQALHEAGIEPNWVIGTSIGAINGAIIAGNEFDARLDRLREFWKLIEGDSFLSGTLLPGHLTGVLAGVATLFGGVPNFYTPNTSALLGMRASVGVENAAFYSTKVLAKTLAGLIDFERLKSVKPRLTIGAVNVLSGQMHYFDSRSETLTADHVLASGALPPAFAAIRINGDPYWDGGLYSNTPIETVFDDNPRRDSVVFSVQMWHSSGPEPKSIWEVLNRQKDIQFGSRAESHIARQGQIHRLRHIVRELVQMLPEGSRNLDEVKKFAGYGCGTTMHIIRLNAQRLDGDDNSRDTDFTRAGIAARWQAGYADTAQTLERQPWQIPVDPMAGVAVYDSDQLATE